MSVKVGRLSIKQFARASPKSHAIARLIYVKAEAKRKNTKYQIRSYGLYLGQAKRKSIAITAEAKKKNTKYEVRCVKLKE